MAFVDHCSGSVGVSTGDYWGMLHAEVGVVHYMSVSGSGVGRMGRLDAIVKPGTGNHRVTGISERQKESFSYALTWVDYQLARCRPPRSLKSLDVHVYFDNMAVPKDGPSASVAMGLAVLSAATGASILPGVAITGEITPRGGIAPVGGVFQKVTAALKGGATTIIVPRENAKDVPQPSDAHAENVLMIATDSMDVALSYAMGESSAWDERYRSRAALLTEFLVALAQGQFDVAEQKSIQMRRDFPRISGFQLPRASER